MITVPGNHDYWILSNPKSALAHLDQFGNGFMQWYTQDTAAARSVPPGSSAPPFNFSIDPQAGHKVGSTCPAPT